MFAAREITDKAALDADYPQRRYVVESGNLELMLADWGANDPEPDQLLFTAGEALSLAMLLNSSTLLEERCEHCGAALEADSNPDMEDE